MRIAIIGHGKMGKGIEALAHQKGYEIKAILGRKDKIADLDPNEIDIAFEFTIPGIVSQNLLDLSKLGIATVCGTTAWGERAPEVREAFKASGGKLFFSTNFSVGMYLTQIAIRDLAKQLNRVGGYRPNLIECHHTEKLDMPSGTALRIGEIILEEFPQLTKIAEANKMPGHTEIGVLCFREDDTPGTHTVIFRSDLDDISVTHAAHNRKSFFAGAMSAAEFLHKQPSGIYRMEDLINDLS